jgi:hypothetical protein
MCKLSLRIYQYGDSAQDTSVMRSVIRRKLTCEIPQSLKNTFTIRRPQKEDPWINPLNLCHIVALPPALFFHSIPLYTSERFVHKYGGCDNH